VAICVAERGALAVDKLLADSSSVWQPETSGPAPFKVYGGRIDGVPIAVVTESPPFLPSRLRTFPVDLAAGCDCCVGILAAAVIPLEPDWQAGGVMLVEDHINLLGDSPLIGRNDGARLPFLDMGKAYDRELLEVAQRAATLEGLAVKRGVFVASPLAQSYDSAALATLREAGGNACGTGIVPHVLAARDAGMAVLALGALTGIDAPRSDSTPSSTRFKVSEDTAAGLTSMVRRLVCLRFDAESANTTEFIQSSLARADREEKG